MFGLWSANASVGNIFGALMVSIMNKYHVCNEKSTKDDSYLYMKFNFNPSYYPVCIAGICGTPRGGVFPIMDYTGRLCPKRLLFFRLEVYKRVGISRAEV